VSLKLRKRIALVDLGIEFTGGTSYVQNLVSLISRDADLWLLKLSPRLTIDAAQNDFRSVDLGFARNWGRPLQIPLCMAVLLWLKIRHRLDTVWVNGYPEIALMPWARLIGCTAIATRHLTLLTDKPKWHWIRNGWRVHFLYEHLAPAANKIVCVSEAVADSLRTRVRSEKLVVIQNWVPVLPKPVSPGKSGSEPLRLLFVGRLIKIKGVSLLLDALRRFDAMNGRRSISLTVVGEGEDRAALEEAAADLDVHFAGFQSDVNAFYTRTDVFVNPTLGPEGLPLVSLDAMSYGLPCIFSDLPVHKEITRNGEAALLFEAGNPEDLKRTIELLLESPQLIGKYGRLAREAVEINHGAEFARRRYVEELGL
jgi:glycosyltransferase involved in cell wall biosynthesis